MKKNIFLININEKILILFLILFSFLINQYYGNRGVFPIDSFLHFDVGYRILNGENPFSDFWTVSGPAVDYIQAVFFYIFGVNWSSYVLHASLMNALLTVTTFFVLKNFELKINYCFFYAFLFSILAYPSSGTPFVDHHSAFFSLMGIYFLLLGIKNKEKIYWFLMPVFLGVAFFSKQVPASYAILSVFLILILYSLKKKTFKYLNYSFVGSAGFIILVLIFGYFLEIKFSSFIEQYIQYPQTIGSARYENFTFTFKGIIGHFKFIYFILIPMFYLYVKNFIKSKKSIQNDEIFIFLIWLFYTFSLILHQLLTKNQTFIFFLIPLLTAFTHIILDRVKLKYKSLFFMLIILFCVFSVFKYHLRFNENRKFHEMTDVNFELAADAKKIHNKLSGLNWISPNFKNKAEEEIVIINQIKSYLQDDDRKKMLLSNYAFFSVILNEKLFSPSSAFADDGTTHPMMGNKYIDKYSKLMIEIIEKNNVQVIYIAGKLDNKHIYNYINKKCFNEILIYENLVSYELKSCGEINN